MDKANTFSPEGSLTNVFGPMARYLPSLINDIFNILTIFNAHKSSNLSNIQILIFE